MNLRRAHICFRGCNRNLYRRSVSANRWKKIICSQSSFVNDLSYLMSEFELRLPELKQLSLLTSNWLLWNSQTLPKGLYLHSSSPYFYKRSKCSWSIRENPTYGQVVQFHWSLSAQTNNVGTVNWRCPYFRFVSKVGTSCLFLKWKIK